MANAEKALRQNNGKGSEPTKPIDEALISAGEENGSAFPIKDMSAECPEGMPTDTFAEMLMQGAIAAEISEPTIITAPIEVAQPTEPQKSPHIIEFERIFSNLPSKDRYNEVSKYASGLSEDDKKIALKEFESFRQEWLNAQQAKIAENHQPAEKTASQPAPAKEPVAVYPPTESTRALATSKDKSIQTNLVQQAAHEFVQKLVHGMKIDQNLDLSSIPPHIFLNLLKLEVYKEKEIRGGFDPITINAVEQCINYSLNHRGLAQVRAVKSRWKGNSPIVIPDNKHKKQDGQPAGNQADNKIVTKPNVPNQEQSTGVFNPYVFARQFGAMHWDLMKTANAEVKAEGELAEISRSLRNIFELPSIGSRFLDIVNGKKPLIPGTPINEAGGEDPFSLEVHKKFWNVIAEEYKNAEIEFNAWKEAQNELVKLKKRQEKDRASNEVGKYDRERYDLVFSRLSNFVGFTSGKLVHGAILTLASAIGTTAAAYSKFGDTFKDAYYNALGSRPEEPATTTLASTQDTHRIEDAEIILDSPNQETRQIGGTLAQGDTQKSEKRPGLIGNLLNQRYKHEKGKTIIQEGTTFRPAPKRPETSQSGARTEPTYHPISKKQSEDTITIPLPRKAAPSRPRRGQE